ncbi:MAG: bifunctional (p)ppGpp synthetase/guanosine-3',5'-bis(diphosphate) 3'-pyrophosphohydrolase [Phycisphaeraceae bacterium]|nr:MAG: bifunctional (p)ppGpp synthetase/guanosine-3',5'-bis(diphosphate) 3'-pyrophosphohydrolase [Phycisphaeraceae bacterium]
MTQPAPPGPARHPWQLAASFAAFRHRHQIRKDGRTPYVAHVFRVAMTVRDVFDFGDRAALAAALLHDTIEDTTTDFEDLEERFGREVADLVAALTKNMALPEDHREAEYDRRLASADWRARLIKLADAHDNLADAAHNPAGVDVRKTIAHAERAVALATPDLPRDPAVARAIEAVRVLIEDARRAAYA